ncbi:hypothetical protein [Numidum massiliense]|uniref:hypothetical protein n=1 Tax=Numidum massiliense TaxID=1522315 RepID=UPI0006D58784|nr:hypothetical protein [Numidum massiliense]
MEWALKEAEQLFTQARFTAEIAESKGMDVDAVALLSAVMSCAWGIGSNYTFCVMSVDQISTQGEKGDAEKTKGAAQSLAAGILNIWEFAERMAGYARGITGNRASLGKKIERRAERICDKALKACEELKRSVSNPYKAKSKELIRLFAEMKRFFKTMTDIEQALAEERRAILEA